MQLLKIKAQVSSIWAKGCILMCVFRCVCVCVFFCVCVFLFVCVMIRFMIRFIDMDAKSAWRWREIIKNGEES